MSKAQIFEGDWVAVPLRDHGYAVGLVARVNPGGVLFGYFFGPRRDQLPALEAMRGLRAADALLVTKFGHLGIRKGTWPRLGRLEDWAREKWPMPVFGRIEELSGRAFRVFYADEDPNRLLREEQTSVNEATALPDDGLAGAGYVEIVLTNLLA